MTTVDAPAQIILIEDDTVVNAFLRDWLELRWKTLSFLDSESALRELPPSTKRTILIIDYSLPVYSGPVLKKNLESRLPNAKYILTCGMSNVNLAEVGHATGFDAVLAKPYGLPELTQKIDEVNRYWPE
jgi:DNA-binding NtrC family response regulator